MITLCHLGTSQGERRRQRILPARLRLPRHVEQWEGEGSRDFAKWTEIKGVIYRPRTGAASARVPMCPGTVVRASAWGMDLLHSRLGEALGLVLLLIHWSKVDVKKSLYDLKLLTLPNSSVKIYSKSTRYSCCVTHLVHLLANLVFKCKW